MKIRHIAIALVTAANLVGCGSSDPSSEAIAHSMQEQMRAQLRFARDLPRTSGATTEIRKVTNDDPEQIVFKNVKILESEALDNGDYELTFTIDIDIGDHDIDGEKVVTKARHTGNGWHVDMPSRRAG